MPGRSLNELVKSYRSSGQGREEIVSRVGELLYRIPDKYGFDCEDDAADAFLRYRGRIARMADRYEDHGQSFEAYLASNLRFLARTMRRERRKASEKELVCERADIEKPCAPLGSDHPPEPRPATLSAGMSREAYGSRLVFLALKCAWEMEESDLDRVAQLAGVGREWLASVVSQGRRALEPCRARFERISSRRNQSWCRLRLLQSRFGGESDGARREQIGSAIDREKRRLERIRAELASFRPTVPNSLIARILGVPKGTVDSGLYYLKRWNGGAAPSTSRIRPACPGPRPRRRSDPPAGATSNASRRRLPEAAFSG